MSGEGLDLCKVLSSALALWLGTDILISAVYQQSIKHSINKRIIPYQANIKLGYTARHSAHITTQAPRQTGHTVAPHISSDTERDLADAKHAAERLSDLEANANGTPSTADKATRKVTLRDFSLKNWGYIFRRASASFLANGSTDLAGTLTYFAVLSVFPALLALVSLLGVFGRGEESTAAILGFLHDNAPESMYSLLKDPIQQLTSGNGAGLILAIGILSALWTASGYTGAFGRALNRIYGVREGRPFWVLKPVNMAITAAMIVLVLVMILALLLGGGVVDMIAEAIPGADLEWAKFLWLNGRWLLIVLSALWLVRILYAFTPNATPSLHVTSPGAIIALAGMGLGGLGFTFYANNFSKYNATYGIIGGVIVMLLFIWIMNNMLLFGAQFDAEVERMRQLHAGLPSARRLQVTVHDERNIAKYMKTQEKLIAQAEEFSEQASGQQSLDGVKRPGAINNALDKVAKRRQKNEDTLF